MRPARVKPKPTARIKPTRSRTALRLALLTSATAAAMTSTAAAAGCTLNTAGTTVSCTGTSSGYSNLSSGISLNADSSAAITGPVLLGNSATVANAGSLTSATAAPLLQVGANSAITNSGTISLTSTSNASPAVLLGDHGTFTNDGTLSALAGSPVIQFGQAGTFINNSDAKAAVTGNIYFGPNVSGGTSTLQNDNTAFGITGNIYSTGNTSIDNDGLIDGDFVQTATGGSVAIVNDTLGIYSGSISTGDTTALTNNGTLSITSASSIGSARLGVSHLTNDGTLNIGTASPTELVVNGAFANGATGILNIGIRSNGASAPVAGTSFSQIYAAGSNGTATLGGTLNLVPTAGFYPTGSTYNVVVADQSISGNFAVVNGSTLPFISFVPVGIVTVGTQQAYEVEAIRSTTYANAIAGVATPVQETIATALQPLVDAANADPTSPAATLVGDVDLLTIPQTQTLLDQINPAGYLDYAQAVTDQVNLFDRQVMLRTLDPKYDDARTGYWVQGEGQFHIGKTPADGTAERIWGVTGGFDISSKHWLGGVALGYSSASLKNGLGSLSGHNNAYVFGGYGSYRAGPFRATAQVDYDLGSISTSKILSLSYTTTTSATDGTTSAAANNATVTANPGDHLFKATGTIGFDLTAAAFKASPFVGVDYARGGIHGFTEDGADAADLTVASLKIDRTDLLAGVDLSATRGDVRPYVRAMYRSELGNAGGSPVSAYFAGYPATDFTIADTSSSRHEADIDAGVNLVDDPDGMSVFAGYQGTIRKHMSAHGFMGGIRIQL